MTTPYVYIIEEISTGIRYIGSSRRKGCHPSHILTRYFTSSESVKQKIKQNGPDSFRVVYIEIVESPDAAVEKEMQLIIDLDAINSSNYYNMSLQHTKWHVANFVWITDGIKEQYLHKDCEIPEGWRLGRKPSKTKGIKTNKKYKKISRNGVTKNVDVNEIDQWLKLDWEIGDATNSAKISMWITNGVESQYVNKNTKIPDGWYNGRASTADKVTDLTTYKLLSIRAHTVITPHLCAINLNCAVEIYKTYYGIHICGPVFTGKNNISKMLLTKRPDFCNLFGITQEDIGKNIRDLGIVQLVKGLWKTFD